MKSSPTILASSKKRLKEKKKKEIIKILSKGGNAPIEANILQHKLIKGQERWLRTSSTGSIYSKTCCVYGSLNI